MAGFEDDRKMIVKTVSEIETMREVNQIVAEILVQVENAVDVGVSTWELDKLAEGLCVQHKVRPAFKGYRGFKGSLCVSLNEQVVHGIPSKKCILKKGDIISIDFGVQSHGFYGDSAITVPVSTVSPALSRLLEVTQQSLDLGIEKACIGNRVSDISAAVQGHVEENGFSVVRQFVGHGIGSGLHEAPEIPNFVENERSPRLVDGLVLAIEPMVNMGSHKVKVLRDGWTVVTMDSQPSAHFEHTVAVTKNGPVILSSRENFK